MWNTSRPAPLSAYHPLAAANAVDKLEMLDSMSSQTELYHSNALFYVLIPFLTHSIVAHSKLFPYRLCQSVWLCKWNALNFTRYSNRTKYNALWSSIPLRSVKARKKQNWHSSFQWSRFTLIAVQFSIASKVLHHHTTLQLANRAFFHKTFFLLVFPLCWKWQMKLFCEKSSLFWAHLNSHAGVWGGTRGKRLII